MRGDQVTEAVNEGQGNWFRWGTDDQRGALNTIDASKCVEAVRLVRRGVVYSLAIDLATDTTPFSPPRGPVLHFMSMDPHGIENSPKAREDPNLDFADDYLVMPVQSGTHVDALCHIWEEGTLYNGYQAGSVTTFGAEHLGAEHIGAVVTRGVLLDVAGTEGRPSLDGGEEITVDMLAKCARETGTTIDRGDVILVRTGWLGSRRTRPKEFVSSEPGIGVEAAKWLASQDVAMVGSDNLAIEPLPFAGTPSPVHRLLVRRYGIPLLELVELDALARDGVFEFLFVMAALPIVGATGSPVNPVAVA